MKKIKCNVCEHEFDATMSRHYISTDGNKSGLSAAISGPDSVLYDTFDCPICGCQVVTQERKRAAEELKMEVGEYGNE